MRLCGKVLSLVSVLAVALLTAQVSVIAEEPLYPLAPSPVSGKETKAKLTAVAVDDAGDYYVTGSERTKGYRRYAIVRKYRRGGGLDWERAWRLSKPRGSNGVDVTVGSDGSVYVVGSVWTGMDEGGGWFIRKYSAIGRLRWHHATPGWRKGTAETLSGIAVGRGMVVASGNEFGCCADPHSNGFVRAYALDGRLLWTDPFEFPGIRRPFDRANDVALDSSGNPYVVGWTHLRYQRDIDVNVDREMVVQKLSSRGDVVWTRIFRDSGGKDRDEAVSVGVLGSQLMVAAHLNAGNGDPGNGWLGRFNLNGSHVWGGPFGVKKARAAAPVELSIAPWGATYVVGDERDRDGGYDLFLRKWNPRGRLLWATVIDKGRRSVYAGGVAALAKGAYATGQIYAPRGKYLGSRIWRFAA
jgi:hypothetical protein